MASSFNQICLYSYNSRGSGMSKLEFIRDLLSLPTNRIPIFCIQEHFLLRSNINKLSQAFKDYSVLAIPAYKNFHVQDSGRPMGGLATIIPKDFRKYITILPANTWRLQPLKVQLNSETIPGWLVAKIVLSVFLLRSLISTFSVYESG